jgi:glycosyltransferase involved in cell wall biosynthesis
VRDDITRTYRISEERITVTPLAAAPRFAPVTDEAKRRRVRERYGLTGEYILAVGSIQPRKNLVRLIRAYTRLSCSHVAGNLPSLVLVGKKAWLFAETIRAAKASGLGKKVIFTGYVPESDLPLLYTDALCFVYPSYFEGFGLPPLEAMSCGTPVITGNRTSLPEVVGDAALMVDPFNEEAITDALRLMIQDTELRHDLSRKGLEQARRFNWRETARLTLDAYEQAMENGGQRSEVRGW